jgi:hypothetical protein
MYIDSRESLDTLAEQLDAKLRNWKPETAAQVRMRVAEVIALADAEALHLLRSRARGQAVLDLLDAPPNPVKSGWLISA